MAKKHISRRQLICQAPMLAVATVATSATGIELTNDDEQEWKDRLIAASLKLRELSLDALRLLEDAEKRENAAFFRHSAYCDEAYRKKEDEQADAEIDLFDIIFEGT